MEMAFQDLAASTSLQDQQRMRRDMEENIGIYIRDNFHALQQVAANGDIAAHVLNNMHHMEVPEYDMDQDSVYAWDSVDGSLDL